MKFADLTWKEIKELIDKQQIVAIISLGCTEQQGPHLTVDWDNLFITRLCLDASEKVKRKFNVETLVLPTLPVGPTQEHWKWPGYLHVSKGTHRKILSEILEGLRQQGFKKVIVWSGCGGHEVNQVIEEVNSKFGNSFKVKLPKIDYPSIVKGVCGEKLVEGGGHADAVATSWCLFLYPDQVRREEIKNSSNKPVDWSRPIEDFSLYTHEGALGNVTLANKESGRKSWEAITDEAAKIVADFYFEK